MVNMLFKFFKRKKKNPLKNEVDARKEKDFWFWYRSDFSSLENDIIQKVSPYTMTSPERIVNLVRAVEFIHQAKIEGDFVECGVWRGGSSMASALTLNHLKDQHRHLYLYDTYDGMSEPTEEDISRDGEKAESQLKNSSKNDARSVWCYSALEEVRSNMASTGYPLENIHFVEGKVEDTIPQTIPEKIAILRLDTDWYESTRHELEHLFPRLEKGGIIIIDDYGHWEGCRKAVDEYIKKNDLHLFLMRVDYTGRMAVKSM